MIEQVIADVLADNIKNDEELLNDFDVVSSNADSSVSHDVSTFQLYHQICIKSFLKFRTVPPSTIFIYSAERIAKRKIGSDD